MSPAPRYTHVEEERLVLDAASKCIAASSLLDFKMSAIAGEAGISIGSVYKHVQSKEDVMVALAARMSACTKKVLEDVLAIPLSTPERLIGIFLLNPLKIHKEPFGVHLEMLTGNDAVLQRASERWAEKLSQLDYLIEDIFIENVQQSEDLKVKEANRASLVNELMLGIWSMHAGFVQVAFQRASRKYGDLASPLPFPLSPDHSLVASAMRLINSYPWAKPLTKAGIKKAAHEIELLNYR
jgi:AcrR family transcriptional regulator